MELSIACCSGVRAVERAPLRRFPLGAGRRGDVGGVVEWMGRAEALFDTMNAPVKTTRMVTRMRLAASLFIPDSVWRALVTSRASRMQGSSVRRETNRWSSRRTYDLED